MAKKARDESTSAENGVTKRRSARYTAEISIADAAAYLEAVAHALRENRLVVQADKKTLDALVAPRLTLDVAAKASRGGRRTSLDLSLRWKERYDGSSHAPPSESNSEESSAETAVSPAPEPPPSDSTFDPE